MAAEIAGQSANCSFNPDSGLSPREIWSRLSSQADLVAPLARRRAAQPRPEPVVLRNFVDTEIFGKMERDGIRWTVPSSDEEFLRRVSLDLTGQIPTAEKVKQFLADTSAGKRDRLIDELLASEEFVDRWTLWLGDHVQMVQISDNVPMGRSGRDAYYTWMRDSFRAARPYDQMVRELITGRGLSHTSGPANYWVRQIQTNGPLHDTWDNLSARTGDMFLGLPLECVSCHSGLGHLEAVNTGLVPRTRTEFWKNAAFFATDAHRFQEGANLEIEWLVEPNRQPARAQYSLNTTSGNKTPRQPGSDGKNVVDPAFFLSGEQPREGEGRREAYARILTAHPQFARATVNYIWRQIFGLGIVEPADSFDLLRQDTATLVPGATLQPTHPELLTKLANHFVANGYNIRTLLRTIVQSSAYQLSSYYTPGPWNELWTPYYARHYPRRMLAESVIDAIIRVTGVNTQFQVANSNLTITRAMQLQDPTEGRGSFRPLLDAFGRGDRDSTARSRDGSIVQALVMLNDPFVTTRIRATSGTNVDRILRTSQVPATIVEELYIATLSRRPSTAERVAAVAYLQSGDLARRTEDLQYALLNRLQFLYN
ncbi:MAG TPA: DUF1549 domain-containing protein [Thermoanaerobaculia bacterium]|nr:DUF1549 domain-containing protein [Thermoanaerobaculia bacterium]